MSDDAPDTSATATVYVCHNTACTLGSRVDPGRFTSGITPVQKHMLTGEPVAHIEEGGEYGEGYCPNCGELGVEEVA